MTPQTLRNLREQRGMTREQLAEWLGDCSASTVNKWERDMHAIPSWVEEKMLRAIQVTLPLDELHMILDEAKATGQSASTIIADSLRLWLAHQRQNKSSFTSQPAAHLAESRAWTAPLHAQTVASTKPSHPASSPMASANIVPLPPQHVAALNEDAASPPVTEERAETTYAKPRRKRS